MWLSANDGMLHNDKVKIIIDINVFIVQVLLLFRWIAQASPDLTSIAAIFLL
jgi:hypothetical protein